MSTVAVVDILLVLGGWFQWVFLVELADEVWRVFEVAGGVPGTVGVVETGPLDSILDLISLASGVENFFHFPLLSFLDDDVGWWWLAVSGDGFCTGCGFEEADMEDWVDSDRGQ